MGRVSKLSYFYRRRELGGGLKWYDCGQSSVCKLHKTESLVLSGESHVVLLGSKALDK